MFDKQQGNAAFAQPGDNGKNVLDHLRGKAHRRLVEDQQPRAAEQGAVKGKQLLLATGQQPGKLMLALAQAREALEDLVHLAPDGDSVTPEPGTHLQVFQHRHSGEDPPSFRDHHQSVTEQGFGPVLTHRFTVEFNTAAKVFQPGNGAHGGAFPRAVRADQRSLFALVQGKGDIAYGLNAAVMHVHTFHLQ